MKIAILPYRNLNAGFWVFIAGLASAILFSLAPLEYSFPFLILFFGIILGAFIILSESPENFNKVFFLFIAGFLIRVLVSVFLYCVMNLLDKDYGFYIGDGCNYSLNGWKISRLWELGVNVTKANFVSSFGSASGAISNYDFLNAFVYSISGYSPLSLFFINCLAGSLSIIMVFLIANKIFNKKTAFFSGAFCTFLPSFILWSSQNLKDPLTNLSIVCFLYFLIKLRHDLKLSAILLLCFCALALYYVRILMFIPICIASLIYFLFCFRIPKMWRFVFIVFLALIALSLLKGILLPYISGGFIEEINSVRSVRASGNLAYFPGFRFSSWWSILVYMPLGFLAVWLSPFPWQSASLSQIFVLPETFIWYALLPFAFKGIQLSIKDKIKDSHLLITAILTFSVFLGIYEGNLGTLYRHKAVFIMLVYIFIGAGLYPRLKIESV